MSIASILLDLWRGGEGFYPPPPPGTGTPKKPRRNRVKTQDRRLRGETNGLTSMYMEDVAN